MNWKEERKRRKYKYQTKKEFRRVFANWQSIFGKDISLESMVTDLQIYKDLRKLK